MMQKISDNIWKMSLDCNLYFLDFREKIIIDTGKRGNRHLIEQFLGKLIDLGSIQKVIFTHLHYDHIGNFDLFKNAEFYASQKEINDFKKNPEGTVLNEDILQKFIESGIELKPIESIKEELKSMGLEIIETPGHTAGSICIWYPDEKILFSGDTLLKKSLGRTDLPTSDLKGMQATVNKLSEIGYKILATGHDY